MKEDHIIQKVFIEISVNNKDKALNIKDDINSFLSIEVFPEIEKYINALEYKFANYSLQIPRLELNLDVKNSALNTELKDKIVQLFKKELSEITDQILKSDQTKEIDYEAYLVQNLENIIQAFIDFLKTRSMSWLGYGKNKASLLEPKVFENLISSENFKKSIIPVLSKQLEMNQDVKNSVLNTEIKDKIVRLFKKELPEITEKILNLDQTKVIDYEAYLVQNLENIIQAFIDFLKTRSMSWLGYGKNKASLLEPKVFENLISSENFKKSIIPILSKQLELNQDVKNVALNTELKDKIVQLFKKELSEITDQILKSDQTKEIDYEAYLVQNLENIIQAFTDFLKTGSISSLGSGKNKASLLEPKVFENLISSENFKKKIIPVLSQELEMNQDVKNSMLNTELNDKIAKVFKENLSEITDSILNSDQKAENNSKAYLVENQEKIVQTFIYFLKTGSMPWWNSGKKSISFLEPKVFENLISSENFQKSIIPVLSKPNVQERIINQLSNEQIAQLCLTVLKNRELKINLTVDIISRLSKLRQIHRQIVWVLILKLLSEYLKTPSRNLWEYFLQHIVNIESVLVCLSEQKNNYQNLKIIVEIFPFIKKNEVLEIIKNNSKDNPENKKTLIETIHQKNAKFQDELSINDNYLIQKDGQYVKNAGLILIHPFIKTLFEHCDLLHPKTQQLINPELCAHLLHYIATGKTNALEYDMVFEKFLCNIPMNQTVNRHLKLSCKQKKEAKNVIESVQQNWNPMKKSSVELLQNEFFQRPGKLAVTDHDYNLTIERKTQDILLDKLAWGISLAKLPWQEKFIFVNW